MNARNKGLTQITLCRQAMITQLYTCTKDDLAVEQVVTTYAPHSLAIWIAMVPTPPEPAWMSTLCPARSCAPDKACEMPAQTEHDSEMSAGAAAMA